MAELQHLQTAFTGLYGAEGVGPIHVFHVPGRDNLIGQHTDYNGGYVFPAALTFGTTMLIRKRDDGQVGFASTNFPLHKHISIAGLSYDAADDWMNYPKGIIAKIQEQGLSVGGYDILYSGAIP